MESESKNRNGDGAEGIPGTAKKVVQSLKEIVNSCTDQEIYAVLRECDMDPDRAVERLLAQDTFQEVKSKRERRKEMKEALDSRSRGSNVGLSSAGKTGNGQNVVQIGSAHVTYNELGKATDKGELGSVCPSVTSYTTCVIEEHTKSDSFSIDSGRQSLGTGVSKSVSDQVSPGLQTSWLGVGKGHPSMADIVRMGRPSQDAVFHYHSVSGVSASGKSESSSSAPCQNHSEQPVFLDEWPMIEKPITGNSQTLNMAASSNANEPSEHPNLNGTAASLCSNCELDAVQVSRMNVAGDSVISDKIESASISSKPTITSNAELGSQSNNNLKHTGSSDFDSSYDHNKAASDFQRLSISDSELEVPSSEDNCTVVLPNHLQALAAECSHLSFGTYNGGSNSASSAMLPSNISRSGLEGNAAAVYCSSAQYMDASSVNDGEQLGFDVPRGTAGDKNYDFLSSPQQELVKHISLEAILGQAHEYNTVPSVPDPSFQKSQWVTPSLPCNRPGLQSENLSNFPREMEAYSNLMPGDVSAFLRSQSQLGRYNNAVSTIGNSAISMSEVMKPGSFVLPHRFALPQDLTAQSLTHLEQFADTRGYRSLPRNLPYATAINSQQAFSGGTAYKYNQSSADMNYNLPQNRNEFLMHRLPPARDAIGYGNPGSPFYNQSFLSNPSLGHMPSSNFNEILPSQHNGARNLSSIQQRGSFTPWDYGAESRSSFLPESTRNSFPGQPSQAPPQYLSPGFSDLNHSQTRVVEELQRPGDFQDLSSKQSHQFWQQNH